MSAELIRKYDIPAPRYTSYPTVPYWTDNPTEQQWLAALREGLTPIRPDDLRKPADITWAMYLHVPFCESLCTFCGCNTSITKSHKIEEPYAQKLIQERNWYLEQVPALKERRLRHLHLGGGSPTFLSEETLEVLISSLLKDLTLDPNFEGSIEVDPRRTRPTQIQVLRRLGFDRLSLGIQDFDPEVQKIIHRYQTFEQAEAVVNEARRLGYRSLNFDLVYGLPKQSEKSITHMMKKTLELRPDRIALYSFALVPWIKPGQKLFKDEDLPKGEAKRRLYEMAREELLGHGYIEIGMDHFALATDSLAESLKTHRLHRNFMGYSDQPTDVLLGLGVSSISETPTAFAQNEKVLPKYEAALAKGGSAIFRGHLLNEEDRRHRAQILKLMTLGETSLEDSAQAKDLQTFLAAMIEDHLVEVTETKLRILEAGRPFLRNACLGLDLRYRRAQPQTRTFSSSI